MIIELFPLAVYNSPSVVQWVKRWPTDLAVLSSSPTRHEIFSTIDGVPIYTAFHYHPPIVLKVKVKVSHRPDMTEILLKRT